MTSAETLSQIHRRNAEEWEHLLQQVRALPNFESFMSPVKLKDLVNTTRSGPVVFVNIYESRCDALALLPNTDSVVHIPLTTCSHDMILKARAQLVGSLIHADVRTRNERRPIFDGPSTLNRFHSALEILWVHIVRPILENLGYLNPVPGEELPHITWRTTGPLGLLPIHAAGKYDQPSARIFDYVISSYTPSLSALLKSPQSPSEFRGILAISQAETAGCAPLPGTIAELAAIRRLSGQLDFTHLDGPQATAEAILNAMEEHSWVHLACHAVQNKLEPTKSAFHVYNGTLDLASITRKSIKNAGLAFLSACQTATGDEKLSDEAVHLAAGMIMAGYPSVIATMWSIKDQDAPVIAERVYTHLLEDGVADARKAAKAVHLATAFLRDSIGEREFARWVPYVHIGS